MRGYLKIVVTGGAGYIGSYLVKKLMEEGNFVKSVDDLSNGHYQFLEGLKNKNLHLITGDIRDSELLSEAFRDADAVAHLAAISSLDFCRDNPEEAISVNIFGTHQVLEAARKEKVKKIIFCSSASVYGDPNRLPVDERHPLQPLNLYGVTKVAGEKLMESYHLNYGIDTISLRFGNVFGVGLYTHWDSVIPKFVKQGLEGNPLTIYGDGESSRDFVHIDDIIGAIILALRKEGIGGEVFNVGGEAISIGRLSEIIKNEIGKHTGKNVNVVHLPERAGEAKNFSYDLDKIEKCLGYKPSTCVKEGVSQLVKYWVNHCRTGS